MKKTFTLSIAVLIFIGAYAYPSTSAISISSTTGTNLRVMIDGSRYNSNDNQVYINNLTPGYHNIKIYQRSSNRRSSWFGNDGYRLVYNSNIVARPRYDIDIVVNRFGKVFYDEQIADRRDDEDDWNNNGSNGGWNNNDYNTGRAMNAQSFNRMKETLRNESFENTRLTIAKQVIADNYFTTEQMKDVLGLFSFENNKLDIAKYAYRYTVDKNEYYTLADCFSFSNNKNELMRYIQNYR